MMSFLPIFAHSGQIVGPHDLLSAWQVMSPLTLMLLLAGYLYHRGAMRVWQRAGRGHGITEGQYRAFMGALVILAIALLSPLDTLSDVLFSAHMVQHVLLMLVAAPLLAISDALYAITWALPRHTARSIGQWQARHKKVRHILRFLIRPISAWLIFVFALWLWHLPIIYEAALNNELIHEVEHGSFVFAAYLFWWVISQQRHTLNYSVNVILMFMTMLQGAALGMLLVFSSHPWYSAYEEVTRLWGLIPLHDQQLAGLIMWLTGGFVYTACAAFYLWKWLNAMDQVATG
ncbi:cytochrome c oxidase assembly protein [Phototrophicus methaneseepsis]|uniref:Cytochrome c oxidase assembly protein n=1 Tax=Phototrophicus methaneseepsis TaxID=2710758 RepID=A0A7S8E7G1_9CHLR|nr:cytochrome c oxidase assembly protein [Phototrophicus methaneseepsis]QPC81739.1 cytochrome c oxidase assembly protein [Phototrophicus methaneseepsis]